MANAYQSGSIYVDTTGSLTTKPVKVAYILYTPDTANDALVLRDGGASDPIKTTIKGATAKHTIVVDLSTRPMVFVNGIYATVATSGTATLIITSEGGSI